MPSARVTRVNFSPPHQADPCASGSPESQDWFGLATHPTTGPGFPTRKAPLGEPPPSNRPLDLPTRGPKIIDFSTPLAGPGNRMESFYYVVFSILAVLVGGLLLTQSKEGSMVPSAGDGTGGE